MAQDARAILNVQALRAFAYGLGSVVIGVSLADSGLSGTEVGGVLASLLAGAALVSVLLARYGDRIGRRRCYRLLLLLMAAAGTVFALTGSLPALILAGLTGTVSTDVVESGPFTSLEQAMLPHAAAGRSTTRLFGTYNTIATLAGSLGALAAATGALIPSHRRDLLLAYPLVAGLALLVAARLSPAVEIGHELRSEPRPPLQRSRSAVAKLSALFALDSFGGGFVVQAFIAYLLSEKYGASTRTLAVLFFAIGLVQAGSFQIAVRLAERFGLLRTMVFTHLPSNLLLAAVAFAPNLWSAIVLLLGRFTLSQMDVPTRQAYVVGLVDPEECTAAAAYTNTARYAVRPFAPAVAGAVVGASFGAPFLIAGALKSAYDLTFYALFRRTPLASEG